MESTSNGETKINPLKKKKFTAGHGRSRSIHAVDEDGPGESSESELTDTDSANQDLFLKKVQELRSGA